MILPTDVAQEIIQKAFPGIHSAEAAEMARAGETRSYPARYILCRENALESIFYIILSGEVQVTKLINDSEVRLLNILKPGDFFGEMALIHNAPRAATVTALAPVTVLEIHKDVFSGLLKKNSSVSLAMVREVSRRLRDNDEMAIEDLRMKARELAAAYQQLAEQDYARQDFLTTIAHELRTPLTTSYGYIQAISMGMVPPEGAKSTLDTVARNLKQIIGLVNDILFLYELELILLEFQPTDLAALVAAAVEAQRPRAARSGVDLRLKLPPGAPLVNAEPRSLERVINILLDNAIKFSPLGGPTDIELDYDNFEVSLRVSDSGVGIPPEAMPRLFRRFFRLDEVGGHLFSGSGLGLSIAKQVVEQHGGKIEVRSELGKGSVFTIRLKH